MIPAEPAALLAVFAVIGAMVFGIIVCLGCRRHVAAALALLSIILALGVLLLSGTFLR